MPHHHLVRSTTGNSECGEEKPWKGGITKAQSANKGTGRLNGSGETKAQRKAGKINNGIQPKYPKLTEDRIQKYIHEHQERINPGKSVMIFNRYYFKEWESDILIIHSSGELTEIEVKISTADFAHDFTKEEKHKRFSLDVGDRPNQFYYAVPLGKVPMISPDDDRLPDYAGLIGIREDGSYKLLKSAPNQHNEKFDDSIWKLLALNMGEIFTYKQMQKLTYK